jgi:hypothetical protein
LFFEWGEESHDKMPEEPYNANYGSCGEWSIFGTAIGRLLLIPTRLANDWGEDHVWNEFYVNTWHHLDLNFEWDHAIDDPKLYERGGKTISTVWSIKGDGYSYDISKNYTDTAVVTVNIRDADNNPVDGAAVLVLSEWAVDVGYDTSPLTGGSSIQPLLSFWNFTEPDGRCTFTLGENNYTLIISSSLGDIDYKLRDKQGKYGGYIIEGKEYTVDINLQGRIPDTKFLVTKSGVLDLGVAFSKDKKIQFEIVSQVQKPRHVLSYPLSNHLITGNVYPQELFTQPKINFFICDAANFQLYRSGKVFHYINLKVNTTNEEVLLPAQGEWYLVWSNIDSLFTEKTLIIRYS